MTVIYEPAEAIAVGLCLAARTIADGRTERHPRPCGWCDWPVVDLRAMVDGFNAWAGYDERRGTYGRHELRVWQDVRPAAQRAAVLAAQAFPAAEEAVIEVPDTPSRQREPDVNPIDEEMPVWS